MSGVTIAKIPILKLYCHPWILRRVQQKNDANDENDGWKRGIMVDLLWSSVVIWMCGSG